MRWKQWLLTVFLLAVAALVLAYGVGERVPVEHTAVAAQTIAAPPAKVWALLVNVDAQPTWRRGLKSIEELPEENGRQRWIEHYTGAQLGFVLEESDPVTTRVVRVDPMGSSSMDGSWTYQLMAMDDGRTTVTITEHAHLYSPLYRFLSHYILGDTFNQKRYLEDLNKAATS
jgi:uncharacterized protein YndB with AHSA1/START domain